MVLVIVKDLRLIFLSCGLGLNVMDILVVGRGPVHALFTCSALFEGIQSAIALCVPSNQRWPWGPPEVGVKDLEKRWSWAWYDSDFLHILNNALKSRIISRCSSLLRSRSINLFRCSNNKNLSLSLLISMLASIKVTHQRFFTVFESRLIHNSYI